MTASTGVFAGTANVIIRSAITENYFDMFDMKDL